MKYKILSVMLALVMLAACTSAPADKGLQENVTYAKATFAGGCFWCMEPPFEKLEGVAEVISGYSGGEIPNPTYRQVSSGDTGHIEAVQVYYDPDAVTYEELLDVYWRQIDPTDEGGQFVDRGYQYTTAIFYHDEEQRVKALESKRRLEESGRFDSVVTPVRQLENFYKAEEYHQDYYLKNPVKYKFYRQGSGRDRFLQRHW